MNQYKAILFDLNGTLILDKPGHQFSDSDMRIFKRMAFSLDDENEKEAIKREQGWSEKDFWDFVNESFNGSMPNMGLVEIIKNVRKSGLKTVLVSNASGLVMRPIIKTYFGTDIDNLFDEIIISSEVKILKPDQKIYELALDKLGINPDEAIFIDDLEEYLKGARAIGIKTLLFTNNNDIKKELEKLGVLKKS
ncbi:MAG: hypothetical protein DRI56_13175 [Chloroflexota bacterium]|nr:MAG: hypothetical protein DRI56_13175 [Chloroflexota bacterium]